MNRAVLLIVISVFFASNVAHSRSISLEIAPSDSKKAGFAFDITSKSQSDGTVAFRVVINHDSEPSPTRFTTALGVLSITVHSVSITMQRQLPCRSTNHSLVCEFSVARDSLDDSNLCFVFTNVPNPEMPSADIFYARLKRFLERQQEP